MKTLILALSLSLALVACSDEREVFVPEGAVGLWIEASDATSAKNLNTFSLENKGCEPFLTEGALPRIDATFVEPNGDIYNLFRNELGAFSEEKPLGSMNRDGIVTLNIQNESADINRPSQIRFEITGDGTASSTTIFENGSLSDEEAKLEVTSLSQVSSKELIELAEQISEFCTQ